MIGTPLALPDSGSGEVLAVSRQTADVVRILSMADITGDLRRDDDDA